MPKTKQELTDIVQFRVSPEDKRLIDQAADADRTSVAEFLRRVAREASRKAIQRNGGVR